MENEMIERVSRALCAFAGHDPEEIIPGGVPCWTWHTEEARSAIEAMREPTEAMVKASGRYDGNRAAAEWRALIDAALAPAKQPA